jgi:predicted nuclease of predicted toxin-antitoxin system
VKILIDAQPPPGLKLLLTRTGHEAYHVVEIGLRDADDTQLWEYAIREGEGESRRDVVVPQRGRDQPLRR